MLCTRIKTYIKDFFDVLWKTMTSHKTNLSHEKRGHPTVEIFFSFVDMNAFATNHVPVFFVHIVNV